MKNTWFTLDGSFLRLEIEPEVGDQWPNADWTLYRPDGSRVEFRTVNLTCGAYSWPAEQSTLIARNGNRLVWSKACPEQEQSPLTDVLTDDYEHSISIVDLVDRVEVRQQGFGEALVSEIRYTVTPSFEDLTYKSNYEGQLMLSPFGNVPQVVDLVKLPPRTLPSGVQHTPQLSFEYNARYREISKMTMPSGATVEYKWGLDDETQTVFYYDIQLNGLLKKTVKYKTGQGNSENKQDVTDYNFPGLITGFGKRSNSSVIAPDGGTTAYTFHQINYRDSPPHLGGRITNVTHPDGSKFGKTWTTNVPHGAGKGYTRANPYVSWEYETATGASNLVRTRKFEVDQNGNQTVEEERDWWVGTDPAAPEIGTLLRRTETPVKSATPAASAAVPGSPAANGYIELSAARVLGLVASKTVKNGAGEVLESRSYVYDSVSAGNMTEEWVDEKRPAVADGRTPLDESRLWSYTYDKGRVKTVTDPDLKTTTYDYQRCGGFGLSTKSVPDVGTTTYDMHCGTGVVTSVMNPQAGRTSTDMTH